MKLLTIISIAIATIAAGLLLQFAPSSQPSVVPELSGRPARSRRVSTLTRNARSRVLPVE